jgi:SAM-dependent methyltransferase
MHPSAYENAALFFQVYAGGRTDGQVLEVGSQDVNGSLRDLCPQNMTYLGTDFVEGRGVDIVLDDPYHLPFADGSQDIVVCSSCFEHSQLFWLLFLEILRILKPGGLFYLNAPSNGLFHRYPVDCWRFYPDSGGALVEWARRSGYRPLLLESFISNRRPGAPWNDFVGVFLKDEAQVHRFPDRIVHRHWGYSNASLHGDADGYVHRHSEVMEPEIAEKPAPKKRKRGKKLRRLLRRARNFFQSA